MVVCEKTVPLLLGYFATVEALRDVELVADYDSDTSSVPFDNGVIALGVKNVEIGPKIVIENPDGTQTTTNKRGCATTVSITAFVPYTSGCNMGYKLLDRLYTALIFGSNFNISNITVGDASYSRETEALVIKSSVIINSEIIA